MPELPEVESVVRTLRPNLVGKRIEEFESLWPRQVLPDPALVRAALIGREVLDVTRRGKFIAWRLPDGYLLIHLRMSGRLEWNHADGAKRAAHVRAAWRFSHVQDGRAAGRQSLHANAVPAARADELWFLDARKFGRIRWVRDLSELDAELGVEPLSAEFTAARLADVLQARQRAIKPLLLDQSLIAGLGNIYVDEALFRAGIHPLARANRLRGERIDRLRTAIRAVLREAIRRNGTSIDWIYPDGTMQNHLRVYGRGDEPCATCGTAIRRIVVGQRGTHFCSMCQRR